jgi:hypothetical protein
MEYYVGEGFFWSDQTRRYGVQIRRFGNYLCHYKTTVFWDLAPSSLIEIHQLFKAAYCLHHQGDE